MSERIENTREKRRLVALSEAYFCVLTQWATIQEERQLFEDFLLQEIAEAIRSRILEAEEWVQHINGLLKGLPMIGEHYALHNCLQSCEGNQSK